MKVSATPAAAHTPHAGTPTPPSLATQVNNFTQALSKLPAADQFAALADIWSNKPSSSGNFPEGSWQHAWQGVSKAPAKEAMEARQEATNTLLNSMDPGGKLAEQFKHMKPDENSAIGQPSRWLQNHSDAHKLVGKLDKRQGWFKTIRNAAGLILNLGKPEKLLGGLIQKSAGEKNARAAVRELALNQLIFRNIKDPPSAPQAARDAKGAVSSLRYLETVSNNIKEISGQFASLQPDVRLHVLHFAFAYRPGEPPAELKSLVNDIQHACKTNHDDTVVTLLAKMLDPKDQAALHQKGLLTTDMNNSMRPVRGIAAYTANVMKEAKRGLESN